MSGTLDRELVYEILSVVEEITCGFPMYLSAF